MIPNYKRANALLGSGGVIYQEVKMKSIMDYLENHKSTYAAAKHHEVTATQLQRLLDAGAKVDESGQVWIMSKTKIKINIAQT